MKKVMLSIVSAAAGLALMSQPATAMDKGLEKALVEVCKAVKSNSRIKLHTTLKKHRLKYEAISEGLVCNGHDVVTFATLNGASQNANLIAKRNGKSVEAMLAKR